MPGHLDRRTKLRRAVGKAVADLASREPLFLTASSKEAVNVYFNDLQEIVESQTSISPGDRLLPLLLAAVRRAKNEKQRRKKRRSARRKVLSSSRMSMYSLNTTLDPEPDPSDFGLIDIGRENSSDDSSGGEYLDTEERALDDQPHRDDDHAESMSISQNRMIATGMDIPKPPTQPLEPTIFTEFSDADINQEGLLEKVLRSIDSQQTSFDQFVRQFPNWVDPKFKTFEHILRVKELLLIEHKQLEQKLELEKDRKTFNALVAEMRELEQCIIRFVDRPRWKLIPALHRVEDIQENLYKQYLKFMKGLEPSDYSEKAWKAISAAIDESELAKRMHDLDALMARQSLPDSERQTRRERISGYISYRPPQAIPSFAQILDERDIVLRRYSMAIKAYDDADMDLRAKEKADRELEIAEIKVIEFVRSPIWLHTWRQAYAVLTKHNKK